MRFLDSLPYAVARNCDDPARDVASDDTPPFAVPLGQGAQVVVADMTTAPNSPMKPDDARHAQFVADQAAIAKFAARGGFTFLTLHKPILGFAATEKAGQVTLKPNTFGIQSVFSEADPAILPKGVDVVLSGHIHVWEQVSFESDHPSQFIAGFAGTQEDLVPLPPALAADASPAPGAKVAAFSSWVNGFGFMTLERRSAQVWDVKVWDLDGHVMNRCRIEGRKSKCEKGQVG